MISADDSVTIVKTNEEGDYYIAGHYKQSEVSAIDAGKSYDGKHVVFFPTQHSNKNGRPYIVERMEDSRQYVLSHNGVEYNPTLIAPFYEVDK
jgi:hypothetical protein